MAVNTPAEIPSDRARGRPPKTDEQRAEMRKRIVAAAASVYAEFGYRGATVARIAERAGLSKPTFYSFFDGVADVITALVTHSQGELLDRWAPTMNVGGSLIERIGMAIDAYLDTAEQSGDSWLVFHIEQHDPASPARQLRAAHEERLGEILRSVLVGSGRPAPMPETLAVLLGSMQVGCYRYLATPGCDRQAIRAAMLRSALALVGTPDDWREGAEHPELFER